MAARSRAGRGNSKRPGAPTGKREPQRPAPQLALNLDKQHRTVTGLVFELLQRSELGVEAGPQMQQQQGFGGAGGPGAAGAGPGLGAEGFQALLGRAYRG